MAFNTNEFLSRINKNGGLSKSSLFLVRILGLPSSLSDKIDAEDLTFFCKTVNLPSLSLETQDYRNQGFGAMERRPVGMQMPTVPSVFYMDTNHNVLKFFHAWMQEIVNYDLEGGVRSSYNGKLPYEIGYKSDYVAQMEILYYSSNNPNDVYTYKLSNVHPVEVGSLSLSWENNNELALLPVEFSFESMSVDGSSPGVVVDFENNGAGLFEILGSLNSYGQVIKGLEFPTSVQDAINQYTTVSTLFKNRNGLTKTIQEIFGR